MIYRRKLLSYERNFFETRPVKNNRFRNKEKPREVILTEISGQKKRNVVVKDIESNDENIGDNGKDNVKKLYINRNSFLSKLAKIIFNL